MDKSHISPPISRRKDGSYQFGSGGSSYGLSVDDPFNAEVQAYLAEHPEALVPEPVPPEPTAEELKAQRIAEIKAELAALDVKSIRPMREGETVRVVEIIAHITALRVELSNLNK